MRQLLFALSIFALCAPAQLKRQQGAYENDRIAVQSIVFADKESVKKAIGSDFDGAVAVVEITVTPRGGESLDIEREDWTLFSNRDAQKAPAFHPSQLAGQGGLIVKQQRAGGGSMAQPNRPTFGGGIPGMGYPGGGGGIGNTASVDIENKVETTKDVKENPVLATLKAKEMPFGKTLKPVSGLLYFALEGKHKLKDLELWYRGPGGKFTVSYKP